MIYPPFLKPGDTIAVTAPAGAFDHALLSPALSVLEQAGYSTRVMPHTLGRYGTYSGTVDERLSDLVEAWQSPDVSAIMCARGGYGAVHLLSAFSQIDLKSSPKWLIGFSDISALHALLESRGVVSVHASMLKGLARGYDNADTQCLLRLLQGDLPVYDIPHHPLNRYGTAVTGILTGGNLAVLDALVSTPYDALTHAEILMVEDINEPLYKLERMLYRLKLNGTLGRLRALIVGQFTGCSGDVYQMIDDLVSEYDYPVFYDFPIGHVDHNVPMLHGATLTIREGKTLQWGQDTL